MLPKSVQNLINEFSKLPGVGPKTAGRLTFYLINQKKEEAENLGKALLDLTKNLKNCRMCYNITDAKDGLCPICDDKKRDQVKIMVVEEPLDIMAIEKTEYNGLYHVLGGAISPVDGIGPEDLRIKELIERIEKNKDVIKEIILATNPSLEGEATAMFINQNLKSQSAIRQLAERTKIKITRIARGIPIGGDLEYADEMTLTRALEGRKEY